MCNNLVQEYKPWTIKSSQSPQDLLKLKKLLFIVYETLRISSILLQPIVPSLSNDLLTRLNVSPNERSFSQASVDRFKPSRQVNLPQTVLFKRL